MPKLLVNFHWVVRHEAARAAQIHAWALGPFLTANLIAAVINLRGRHPEFGWWRRETEVCRKRGVKHFDAMLDSRQLPTRVMLAALMDAFEQAPRPLLIKCSGGQDRTSLAAALYLIRRDGWPALEAAQAQFAHWPFLHFPKPHQRWLSVFADYAREAADGAPIAAWIESRYDPAALEQWLVRRGRPDAYRRIFRVGE